MVNVNFTCIQALLSLFLHHVIVIQNIKLCIYVCVSGELDGKVYIACLAY